MRTRQRSGEAGVDRSTDNLDNLGRLLRFYLACIEEEDLRSLTLQIAQQHERFISPWNAGERFFSADSLRDQFSLSNEWDRRMITRGAAQAGEVERYFYGYPFYVDARDAIAPLFFMEVTISERNRGSFEMVPADGAELMVNHHFFRQSAAGIEDLQLLQEDLESSFPSFSERVLAAFDYLGQSPRQFQADHLDPFPGRRTEREIWVNRPILFRSERSRFTSNLRRELSAFVRYERLLERVPETALFPLISSSRPVEGESPLLIEVLPLNEAQERAAREGLTAPLTVVTGPPGTGKSQVVVDLVASCALAGKSVLFASKNNKAVDVVRERLRQTLGSDDDWTLRLGNLEQMEMCRLELSARLDDLKARVVKPPEMPSTSVLDPIERSLAALRAHLGHVRQLQQQMECAEDLCRGIEALLPPAWLAFKDFERGAGTELLTKAERELLLLSTEASPSLGVWLKRLFFGRKIRQRLVKEVHLAIADWPEVIRDDADQMLQGNVHFSEMLPIVRQLIAFGRWLESIQAAKQAASRLIDQPPTRELADHYQELKRRRVEVSAELMRAWGTARVVGSIDRLKPSLEGYFQLLEELRTKRLGSEYVRVLKDLTELIGQVAQVLPIWIVTNLSARRALSLEPCLFDLVIIDEASQCDIPSALPLLFRARRAVIIGDPQQLRHVSTLRPNREQKIAKDTGVQDLLTQWSYITRSIYDVAQDAMEKSGSEAIFLAEQYRSHPAIIEFSNHAFYEGRLIPRVSVDSLARSVPPEHLGVFWYDVPGIVPQSSRSAWNEAEISATLSLLTQWWQEGLLSRPELSVGIVTPFRKQMERIELAIQKQPWWRMIEARLVVGTAHRFQGDECDLMIMSPVVAEGLGERSTRWVADTTQLLNVSITRARAALHVVGDYDACLAAGGHLKHFALYAVNAGAGRPAFRLGEQPELQKIARLLDGAGIWYRFADSERDSDRDLLLVSPLGTRYDLTIRDRREVLPPSADEQNGRASPSRLRIDAESLVEQAEFVKMRLARLV